MDTIEPTPATTPAQVEEEQREFAHLVRRLIARRPPVLVDRLHPRPPPGRCRWR